MKIKYSLLLIVIILSGCHFADPFQKGSGTSSTTGSTSEETQSTQTNNGTNTPPAVVTPQGVVTFDIQVS